MRKSAAYFLIITLLISCGITGKEIGRLRINKATTNEKQLHEKEITLDLKKGENINLWSEMDVKYIGDVKFNILLLVSKNGKPMGQLNIDPMKKNVTLGEVKVSVNNETSWSFTGKNTEFEVPEDGKYTFKGILVPNTTEAVNVKKAELVFKI